MVTLVIAFVVSFISTLFVVRIAKTNSRFVNDHDLTGPQKFHSHPVPRIGGVSIVAGVVAGAITSWPRSRDHATFALQLMACGLPAFSAGIAEDVTKNVSPRRRLFFTAMAALLAVWWCDTVISRTAIPLLDDLVAFPWGAAAVTVFVVAGVANAVNIIDGFNGLASMCVVLILASVAYVGFAVGDVLVATLALMGCGAVLGFFVFNFPAGLIFLGDGGAYFLGFYVAEVAILLLHRNSQVSPMFPLLVCIYPVFETVFSIYRKKFLRGMSPGVPDGVHLHMLIYKRLMRWAAGNKSAKELTRRNSMTSPYLWGLCMTSIVPAMLWWNNTSVLTGFLLLFGVLYVTLYWRIVRFRAPRWLIFRR